MLVIVQMVTLSIKKKPRKYIFMKNNSDILQIPVSALLHNEVIFFHLDMKTTSERILPSGLQGT